MNKLLIVVLSGLLGLTGCMQWEDGDGTESLSLAAHGLFIVNEGNFNYGNATLSFYDPADNRVTNEVFIRANGFKLGDVAQSMIVDGDRGWVVVNNSNVIFAIDLTTGRERGRITGVGSPRYMHIVSDTKAYVSQIWSNVILIVNPTNYTVTGTILIPGMEDVDGSTEQMVQIGQYVYCNCWSYQNKLIKIDTETDRVVAEVETGIQPNSLVKDKYGRLWTLTDGGYPDSPQGHQSPQLFCVDPVTMTVTRSWRLPAGEVIGELQVNGTGDALYWIDDDIWRMEVEEVQLPQTPLIPAKGTIYYGLTVDPQSGDVYVADAIDYQQQGIVYRYNAAGILTDQFYVGITPGAYCWK